MNYKQNIKKLIQGIDQVLESETSKWSEEDIAKLKEVKAGLESFSNDKDLIRYVEIISRVVSGGGNIMSAIVRIISSSPDS